jgi:hypothetical protein
MIARSFLSTATTKDVETLIRESVGVVLREAQLPPATAPLNTYSLARWRGGAKGEENSRPTGE